MNGQSINIFWFRRDLRLNDNTALSKAMKAGLPVLLLFIFDKEILDKLENKKDARVHFIHSELNGINEQLKDKNTSVHVRYGKPTEVWKELISTHTINTVFTNRDYEPYARQRDEELSKLLKEKGIQFNTSKDHVLLEPHEVLKDDGKPYVVFTPFSKLWRKTLTNNHLEPHPSALDFDNFYKYQFNMPTLEEMGFQKSDIVIPEKKLHNQTIKDYEGLRNFPAKPGTSKLGIHFRFGTISIRQVAQQARDLSFTYLNELVWREFYQSILWHFPRVVNENFKVKYDFVKWRNNESEFDAWCNGQTGYPIVDAGMRELNTTGYMHNRVRMIVASFLTKHLLIDWRWGEAYFAEKLLDFELASNNGGWQWAAGTGTDAQPYFRIFNPESQTKKFDSELKYIRKWVPEFQELTYPRPIVDHKMARERALTTYKTALQP